MVLDADAKKIIEAVHASKLTGSGLRQMAMSQLATLSHYPWVGVYRLDGEVLRLAEYVGEATDHTVIPVGRGVCGAAVAQDANQLIADVSKADDYLACSIKTKSEIVVLIRKEELILGQIDADGHIIAAFDESDEALLTEIAAVLAESW